jgi:hypothetical protein
MLVPPVLSAGQRPRSSPDRNVRGRGAPSNKCMRPRAVVAFSRHACLCHTASYCSPAGRLCPPATTTPLACSNGHYVSRRAVRIHCLLGLSLTSSWPLCLSVPRRNAGRHRVRRWHVHQGEQPLFRRAVRNLPRGLCVLTWHFDAGAVRRGKIRGHSRPDGRVVHRSVYARTLLRRGQHQQHVWCVP